MVKSKEKLVLVGRRFQKSFPFQVYLGLRTWKVLYDLDLFECVLKVMMVIVVNSLLLLLFLLFLHVAVVAAAAAAFVAFFLLFVVIDVEVLSV